MYPANADQQVLGYLGRALSLELSAVQLYSTQAMLTAGWGLTEASEKFRTESIEEMGHAERIIGRMLALGVAPNASQLRPVRLGQTLQQLLEIDHAFENDLVKLYSDAVAHCTRCGDQDSRLFFEALLGEEQEHAKELLQWIEKLQQ